MTTENSLVIKVDSTDTARAAKSLDELAAAGGKAEKSTTALTQASAVLAGAATKASTAHAGWMQNMAGVDRAMRATTSATVELSKDTQRIIDRYDPLGTKLRSLQADFVLLRREMGNSGSDAAIKSFQGLEDEISKVQSLMKDAGAAVDDNGKALGGLGLNSQYARRELMQLGKEALSGDFSQMPKTFMSLVTHSNLLSVAISPIGLAVTGVTAALVAGAVAWNHWENVAVESADKTMAAIQGALKEAERISGLSTMAIAGEKKKLQELISTYEAYSEHLRTGITRFNWKSSAAEIAAYTAEINKLKVVVDRLDATDPIAASQEELMRGLKQQGADYVDQHKVWQTQATAAAKAAQKEITDTQKSYLDAGLANWKEMERGKIAHSQYLLTVELGASKDLAEAEKQADLDVYNNALLLRNRMAAEYEIQDKLDKERAAEATKAAEAQWKMVDSYAHTAFDNILDNGKNAFKEIGNAIKKYILKMLYEMTVQKWLISVSASMGMTGVAQAGQAATSIGGMGDIGSMLSGAQSLWSAGSSWLSGGLAAGGGLTAAAAASTAAMTPAAYAAAMSATGATAGAAAGVTAGSTMMAGLSSTLAAIPVYGWIALAAVAAYKIFGGGGETRSGGSYGIGANGQSEYLHGPDGGQIAGAQIQGAVTATYNNINALLTMYGSSSRISGFVAGLESSTGGRGGTYAGGIVNGVAIGQTRETRINQSITPENAVKQLGDDLNVATIMALKAADLPGAVGLYFSTISAPWKMTSAQTADIVAFANDGLMRLNETAKIAPTYFQAVIANFNILQKSGETLNQTADRIITNFALTSGVVDMLGLDVGRAFGEMALTSLEMRDNFVAAMGGMQQMSGTMQAYYQFTRTSDQQKADGVVAVTASFAALGFALPKSAVEFDTLVKSIGIATPETTALTAKLLNLTPSFAAVTDSAEQAAAAIAAIAKTNIEWQNQLDVLTGKETDRSIALRDATDESTRALMQQVYAQQDLKAAVDKVNAVLAQKFDLEAQYANLTGDNTLSRIKELQTIDPANRAMQLRIWAMQNEQSAAQSAAQSTQNVASAYQAADTAQKSYLQGLVQFGKSIKDFLQGLQTGTNASTSPESRLAATRDQYLANLAAAQGGDATAQASLAKDAQGYIDAAQAYYASGTGTQAIIAQIKSELGGMTAATQLDANIEALKAIENAVTTSGTATQNAVKTVAFVLTEANLKLLDTLDANFATLDTDFSKTLTYAEFAIGMKGKATDAAINALFKLTDTNHDGVVSAIEASAVSIGVDFKTWSATQAGTAAEQMVLFKSIDTNGDGLLSAVEISKNADINISAKTDAMYVYLDRIANAVEVELSSINYYAWDTTSLLTNILAELRSVNYYAWDISRLLYNPLTVRSGNPSNNYVAFASGGVFDQPTSFNMGLMGEAGPEAIMPLTRINGKLGVMAANDEGGSKNIVTALREEIRGLRDEIHAGNMQRGAVAVATLDKLDNVATSVDGVKRAVVAA